VVDPTSYRRVSFSDGARDAFVMTGERIQETIGVVGKLFSGRVSVRQLQGAVGISRAAGEAVRKGPAGGDFANGSDQCEPGAS